MRIVWVWIGFFTISNTSAFAEITAADFHRSLYALYEQQIVPFNIKTVEERGNYEGASGAGYRYVDTRYYDTVSGNLLSRVRRDADRPEFVHIIEVNVYENGRLVRDFGSISLPWAPLNPVRVMINLHQYTGELHSFRQYDFYGQVGYEFCEGKLAGKPLRIALDDSDINETSTATPFYRACFGGMGSDWEQYKSPH